MAWTWMLLSGGKRQDCAWGTEHRFWGSTETEGSAIVPIGAAGPSSYVFVSAWTMRFIRSNLKRVSLWGDSEKF